MNKLACLALCLLPLHCLAGPSERADLSGRWKIPTIEGGGSVVFSNRARGADADTYTLTFTLPDGATATRSARFDGQSLQCSMPSAGAAPIVSKRRRRVSRGALGALQDRGRSSEPRARQDSSSPRAQGERAGSYAVSSLGMSSGAPLLLFKAQGQVSADGPLPVARFSRTGLDVTIERGPGADDEGLLPGKPAEFRLRVTPGGQGKVQWSCDDPEVRIKARDRRVRLIAPNRRDGARAVLRATFTSSLGSEHATELEVELRPLDASIAEPLLLRAEGKPATRGSAWPTGSRWHKIYVPTRVGGFLTITVKGGEGHVFDGDVETPLFDAHTRKAVPPIRGSREIKIAAGKPNWYFLNVSGRRAYTVAAEFYEEAYARHQDGRPHVPWNFYFYPYSEETHSEDFKKRTRALRKFARKFGHKEPGAAAQWEMDEHGGLDTGDWEGHCHNAAPASVYFVWPKNRRGFSRRGLGLLAAEWAGHYKRASGAKWRLDSYALIRSQPPSFFRSASEYSVLEDIKPPGRGISFNVVKRAADEELLAEPKEALETLRSKLALRVLQLSRENGVAFDELRRGFTMEREDFAGLDLSGVPGPDARDTDTIEIPPDVDDLYRRYDEQRSLTKELTRHVDAEVSRLQRAAGGRDVVVTQFGKAAAGFHAYLQAQVARNGNCVVGNLREEDGAPNEVWNHAVFFYRASIVQAQEGYPHTAELTVRVVANTDSDEIKVGSSPATVDMRRAHPVQPKGSLSEQREYVYRLVFGESGDVDVDHTSSRWLAARSNGAANYAPTALFVYGPPSSGRPGDASSNPHVDDNVLELLRLSSKYRRLSSSPNRGVEQPQHP